MIGGIQKGSTKNNGAGISSKSQIDENIHKQIVSNSIDNVFGFPHSGWSFKKKVPLSLLTKIQHGWGIKQNGKSTVVECDGYFIFYNDKLVGVTEHKYQGEEGNACERFDKYVTFAAIWHLEYWQIFGSFTGNGFNKPIPGETGGGQTGATIERLKALPNGGATVLTNPTPEEMKEEAEEYFKKLKRKYES